MANTLSLWNAIKLRISGTKIRYIEIDTVGKMSKTKIYCNGGIVPNYDMIKPLVYYADSILTHKQIKEMKEYIEKNPLSMKVKVLEGDNGKE